MKVLFATDGSVSALEAERLLDKIAHRDRVSITVASVVPTGMPNIQDAYLMLDPLPERRKDAQALVDAAVERFLAAGFKATGRVLEGDPGEEIVKLVEDVDWHEMTVLGAGSRSWLGNILMGSVSTHVLHSTPNSVLVVHETIPETDTASVLLGADGSQGATIAMDAYVGLADPVRCETTVVSIEEFPLEDAIPTFPMPPMIDPGAMDQLRKQAEDRAAGLATAAAARLREEHFTAEEKSLVGHAATSILELADKGRFDVTVVGSRGLGPMRRALLGSVSDRVARHARATLVGRHLTS